MLRMSCPISIYCLALIPLAIGTSVERNLAGLCIEVERHCFYPVLLFCWQA